MVFKWIKITYYNKCYVIWKHLSRAKSEPREDKIENLSRERGRQRMWGQKRNEKRLVTIKMRKKNQMVIRKSVEFACGRKKLVEKKEVQQYCGLLCAPGSSYTFTIQPKTN